MIDHITRPLQHERGMEALRRVVTDTELHIDLGKLQTPREVEVTLITSGRVRSRCSLYIISVSANRSVAALGISRVVREISRLGYFSV